MIFGFNTDIRVGSTVYHVQSEVRESEHLLQTQVFVSGRCIGKRDVSFTPHLGSPDFTDEKKHELLRSQHRWVVETIRNGGDVNEVFKVAAAAAAASSAPSQPSSQLSSQSTDPEAPKTPVRIEFVSSSRPEPAAVSVKFRILEGTVSTGGADVVARIMPDHCSQTFAGGDIVRAHSSADGIVEMLLPIPSCGTEANLIVRANVAGRDGMRKFRLKFNS